MDFIRNLFRRRKLNRLLPQIVAVYPDLAHRSIPESIELCIDREIDAQRMGSVCPSIKAGFSDLLRNVITIEASFRATFFVEQYYVQRSILKDTQVLLDQAADHIQQTHEKHTKALEFAGEVVDKLNKHYSSALPENRTN